MSDNLTVFKAWAPDGALWTQWAKPVLFVGTNAGNPRALEAREVTWLSAGDRETLAVIDLPGREGVEEGFACAKLGYRPVPLYNGVHAPTRAVVETAALTEALFGGAAALDGLRLLPDAPPVFLLDSERMSGRNTQPGMYDNRWCVFPQDMPSAAFLRRHGIRRVVVRARWILDDLSHILRRYQEQGITIYQSMGDAPKEVQVHRPPRYKGIAYRFLVILGLRRNSAGGFGGRIPEPMESNAGFHYYGHG